MKKFTFYYVAHGATQTLDIYCSNQGKAIALFKRSVGRCKIVRIVKNNSEPQPDNPCD